MPRNFTRQEVQKLLLEAEEVTRNLDGRDLSEAMAIVGMVAAVLLESHIEDANARADVFCNWIRDIANNSGVELITESVMVLVEPRRHGRSRPAKPRAHAASTG